jgi:hypothetical protein
LKKKHSFRGLVRSVDSFNLVFAVKCEKGLYDEAPFKEFWKNNLVEIIHIDDVEKALYERKASLFSLRTTEIEWLKKTIYVYDAIHNSEFIDEYRRITLGYF